MSQVSHYQKQLLAELGIVSWKLREESDNASSTDENVGTRTAVVSTGSTSTATTSSGLSGLELIKQQMAKSGEAKTPAPHTDNKTTSESQQVQTSVAEQPKQGGGQAAPQQISVKAEPVPAIPEKPQLAFKNEVLIWQSSSMPMSDVVLALESLSIPYQTVTSDSELTHRFALLVAAQQPEKLQADKLLSINSASAKKQFWQALLDFNQSVGNTHP